MLASSSGPYLVRHPWRANLSRLSEPQKSNLFVRRLVSTLTFVEIPQILRALPVREATRTLSPVSSSQAIVTSLSVMSALCARTRYHLHQTYVLSRKVLSLTKPKGTNRNPSAIVLQVDFKLSTVGLNSVFFIQRLKGPSHPTIYQSLVEETKCIPKWFWILNWNNLRKKLLLAIVMYEWRTFDLKCDDLLLTCSHIIFK